MNNSINIFLLFLVITEYKIEFLVVEDPYIENVHK